MTIDKSEKKTEIESLSDNISHIKKKINKIKIDTIKNKFKSPIQHNFEKKSDNFNFKILPKKIEENICVKNISELNLDFSNKETNDTNSIKNNNDLNFIKLYMEHSNYNYLKNKIFFEIENNESLKSFNSSLDSEN